MQRIAIQFYGTIFDVFELSEIDHIKVLKNNFDLQKESERMRADIEYHWEHLGTVPKSGRILEVYRIKIENGIKKYHAHFYNADQVIVGPVE